MRVSVELTFDVVVGVNVAVGVGLSDAAGVNEAGDVADGVIGGFDGVGVGVGASVTDDALHHRGAVARDKHNPPVL